MCLSLTKKRQYTSGGKVTKESKEDGRETKEAV